MSENSFSPNAEKVRESLAEKPTLNTPALIETGGVGLERPEIEAALHELVEAGVVKKRPTGWKLA